MTCPGPTNPNPSSHNMQYGPWSSPHPPTINRRHRPITIICYYVTCDHTASLSVLIPPLSSIASALDRGCVK